MPPIKGKAGQIWLNIIKVINHVHPTHISMHPSTRGTNSTHRYKKNGTEQVVSSIPGSVGYQGLTIVSPSMPIAPGLFRYSRF